MNYVIDLHVTPRGFLLANFILGECTVGVLNCTIKERQIVYKASLAFSVKSIDLLHQKHGTYFSALRLWNTAWIKFSFCPEALLHPESCSFDYPLSTKGTEALFKPDDSQPIMSQTHGLNNSKSRAWYFCVLSFKVGKASAEAEAPWGFLISVVRRSCIPSVSNGVCVIVCVHQCVRPCILLWEQRSRWGLLKELELSFHTGGIHFSVFVCLSLLTFLSSPDLLFPLSLHPLSSLSSSLCCFIHAVM